MRTAYSGRTTELGSESVAPFCAQNDKPPRRPSRSLQHFRVTATLCGKGCQCAYVLPLSTCSHLELVTFECPRIQSLTYLAVGPVLGPKHVSVMQSGNWDSWTASGDSPVMRGA